MYEFYPLLILGAIIGAFSLVFILAFAMMKNKKEAIGFDRNIKDKEIVPANANIDQGGVR